MADQDKINAAEEAGGVKGQRIRQNWFNGQVRGKRDEIIKPHFDEAMKKSDKKPKDFINYHDY